MKKHVVTLFAQSPVHVGAGNSVGVVDSPVMRERHTRIPVIPGSALKGVISDFWTAPQRKGTDAALLFGEEEAKDASAGQLLIGEARVLAFPLRSAKMSFAWITCPLVLERFKRDSGMNFRVPEVRGEDFCFAPKGLKVGTDKDSRVILEEYAFQAVDGTAELAGKLGEVTDDPVWKSLGERLVVISDEIFCYFMENACEIVTRIRIDNETGTVIKGGQFNQEQVPSETLFYFPVSAEDKKQLSAEDAWEKLVAKLKENGNELQVGGDETIGLGFCKVKCL